MMEIKCQKGHKVIKATFYKRYDNGIINAHGIVYICKDCRRVLKTELYKSKGESV